MGKLLISDLDGTLVSSDKILREKTKEAVKKWKEAGNLFVIATGRFLSTTEMYADILDCSDYIICCSGAVIYKDKEILHQDLVDLELVKKLWNIMNETGGYTQIYSHKSLYAIRQGGVAERYEAVKKTLPEGYDIPIYYCSEIDVNFPSNVNKLSFTFESDEEARDILNRLGDLSDYNVFKSLAHLYDIVNKNSGKGHAVRHLIKTLDIKEKDTYVAGDNENDVSMFEFFENSYIVETAPQNIMHTANNVIPSADKCGIAYLIEKLLNKA